MVFWFVAALWIHGMHIQVTPSCLNGGTWYPQTETSPSFCDCAYGFTGTACERRFKDCTEASATGTYTGHDKLTIEPELSANPFDVWCQFDYGGYTFLERRGGYARDGIGQYYRVENAYESFNRSWQQYKDGFGLAEYEYFIGLQHAHELTSQGDYILSVGQGDNQSYYHNFYIANETSGYAIYWDSFDQYTLPLADGFGLGIDGSAIQSIHGAEFSTIDGGPNAACAVTSQSGWWFNVGCSGVNLHKQRLAGAHGTWPDASFTATVGVADHYLMATRLTPP